jgi:HEPN domain-containing protein
MHADQLKASSQKWMTAALVAFSQGPESYDFAVHHAGIAAEPLLKAYLATSGRLPRRSGLIDLCTCQLDSDQSLVGMG